jgi:hypothetical protein
MTHTLAVKARTKAAPEPARANRASTSRSPAPRVWFKLATRAPQPGALEAEADREAQKVAGATPGASANQAVAATQPATAGDFAADMVSTLGVGSPLPPQARSDFEEQFAADFSSVRVHTDAAVAEAARAVGAHAFTYGDHIAFDAGRFDTTSTAGRRLLAHELTHVMQQRTGAAPLVVQRQASATAPSIATPVTKGQSPGVVGQIKDVLRLDQTVAIEGEPSEQSNYLDRAIGRVFSAPLGPDFILVPDGETTGANGISVLKSDFHLHIDPLSGPAIEQRQVYRSRDVAEAVVANLNSLIANTPNYAYYVRDGIIFPTVLSETTIPNLMPAIRQKLEQDRQDLQATGELFKEILWWYVALRIPIRARDGSKEVVKEVGKGGAAAKAAFDAGKVANELLSATKSITNAVQRMLAAAKTLSGMRGLTAAQKVQVMQRFLKDIDYTFRVVDEGARIVMYAEKEGRAFAFIKDTTEILFGKLNTQTLQYVWEVVK